MLLSVIGFASVLMCHSCTDVPISNPSRLDSTMKLLSKCMHDLDIQTEAGLSQAYVVVCAHARVEANSNDYIISYEVMLDIVKRLVRRFESYICNILHPKRG
jgi:hypothetical protein